MNEIIKLNLETLFNQNFNSFGRISFPNFINSMNDFYDDEEEVTALNKLKQNQALRELYELMKVNLNTKKIVVDDLKKGILDSLDIIKQKVKEENKGLKNQIIFVEHDFDPVAYFSGFGEGVYPILETPKYIDFNYKEELFNGIGQISYAKFWKEKVEFEEILSELDDEFDMADLVFNTEIYEKLQAAYMFKTFLLLYEAFDQIPVKALEGLPIKFPLYIYGNEHDCEHMNIYIYEKQTS